MVTAPANDTGIAEFPLILRLAPAALGQRLPLLWANRAAAALAARIAELSPADAFAVELVLSDRDQLGGFVAPEGAVLLGFEPVSGEWRDAVNLAAPFWAAIGFARTQDSSPLDFLALAEDEEEELRRLREWLDKLEDIAIAAQVEPARGLETRLLLHETRRAAAILSLGPAEAPPESRASPESRAELTRLRRAMSAALASRRSPPVLRRALWRAMLALRPADAKDFIPPRRPATKGLRAVRPAQRLERRVQPKAGAKPTSLVRPASVAGTVAAAPIVALLRRAAAFVQSALRRIVQPGQSQPAQLQPPLSALQHPPAEAAVAKHAPIAAARPLARLRAILREAAPPSASQSPVAMAAPAAATPRPAAPRPGGQFPKETVPFRSSPSVSPASASPIGGRETSLRQAAAVPPFAASSAIPGGQFAQETVPLRASPVKSPPSALPPSASPIDRRETSLSRAAAAPPSAALSATQGGQFPKEIVPFRSSPLSLPASASTPSAAVPDRREISAATAAAAVTPPAREPTAAPAWQPQVVDIPRRAEIPVANVAALLPQAPVAPPISPSGASAATCSGEAPAEPARRRATRAPTPSAVID